jgi:hypothetical protein
MKKSFYIIIIFLFAFLFLHHDLRSQYSISNGVSLPTSDTVRVLIVFAEVDFSTDGCPQDLPDNINGNWPVSAKGKRLIPSDAGSFFDYELKKGESPKSYITKFYSQASFGSYILLGDYLPYVISVPCNKITAGNEGLTWILDSLKNKSPADTTLFSAHGLPLNAFDDWTITSSGLPKIKKPDGKIDLLYIIWRNNRFLYGTSTKDNSGYGVHSTSGSAFKNMDGVNNVSSFNAGSSGFHGYHITIAEHLHAIFGGNNWHTAGGRGEHTFLVTSSSYGITGQSFSTMQSACGWDRWMMDWKNPDKNFLISSLDEKNEEINTENFSIDSFPSGGTFILRDFMTSGDAIRIKLPHISWTKKGDVKNQYLWLENRRMNTEYEKYYDSDCCDNDYGKYPYGTPGIYAYIQVGKDLKSGGKEINSSANSEANGLASFLFPFTAEGNFDFYYAWDKVQEANSGLNCNWGNRNLPIDKSKSKQNPFTGFSDLYDYVDFNNDGKLYSGDTVQPGLSEIIGDSVMHNYNSNGDWEDAFCKATTFTKISLSTNPAAVPVYTLSTNYETKKSYYVKGSPATFENRTIWLNGLSVEILEENLYGKGEMRIKIRWDDYDVSQNVRWCGNIALSPNDFDTLKPSLILKKKNKILLDRGGSATKTASTEKDKNGRYIFSDTTVFTCLDNSYILMETGADIIIDNNSKLIMEKGSTLEMSGKNKIILRHGGELIIQEGALLKKGKKCRIIKK